MLINDKDLNIGILFKSDIKQDKTNPVIFLNTSNAMP